MASDRHDRDLDRRVALVTGGSRGVGKGVADELAIRGCTVYVTAPCSEVPSTVQREAPSTAQRSVQHSAAKDQHPAVQRSPQPPAAEMS